MWPAILSWRHVAICAALLIGASAAAYRLFDIRYGLESFLLDLVVVGCVAAACAVAAGSRHVRSDYLVFGSILGGAFYALAVVSDHYGPNYLCVVPARFAVAFLALTVLCLKLSERRAPPFR